MVKVVDITWFKEKQAADRGFQNWRSEFYENFDARTKALPAISDYEEYQSLHPSEREVFIRKQIRRAIRS
jgi:hypothetical protein